MKHIDKFNFVLKFKHLELSHIYNELCIIDKLFPPND